MTASAQPGCVQKGSSCTPRLAFTSTGPRGRSANIPKNLEILLCLPLPASCLLGSITEKASGNTRVACDRFSISPQVGKRGVHQIYTGSYLVLMLSLRQMFQSIYQVLLPPAGWVLTHFKWSGTSGSYQSVACRIY